MDQPGSSAGTSQASAGPDQPVLAVADDGTSPPAERSRGANPHGRGSAGDVIRSLGVIILLTLAVVALVPRPEGGSDQFAGYAEQAYAAAAAAPYPIFAAQPVPGGWTVIRAGTAPVAVDDGGPAQSGPPGVVWRIDTRTETGRYVTLEQSEEGLGPLARRARQQPTVEGHISAGPGQWTRHTGGGLRSLVHTQSGVWTVLSGDASWRQLEALAATLRPIPSASSAR